jgi:hypothetical protein
MEKATVRLTNSILGWILVPISENSVQFLNELYHDDYEKAKRSDLAFMKGQPIEEVVARVKKIANGRDIKISLCGKKSSPTLRLWKSKPVETVKPEVISVDLKWGIWSRHEYHWNDYAPGIWQKMREAFEGTGNPVEIRSAPRKECHYGKVTIERGCAYGHFVTEWDECSELAETLETEDDDGFREMIPFSMHSMEPGMDIDFDKIKTRKFSSLMNKIDDQENELLEMDKKEWELIASCFRK